MTIDVAHSGHLYVFFISISYHDWGKDLIYRNAIHPYGFAGDMPCSLGI